MNPFIRKAWSFGSLGVATDGRAVASVVVTGFACGVVGMEQVRRGRKE